MKRGAVANLLLLGLLLASAAAAAGDIRAAVPLSFDSYYTYEQVGQALEALHRAYPKLTRLEVAGRSDEGRDIWCFTVNNPETGPELEKPAVYVDGNIHGNEIQGGEVCLYLLSELLTRYGHNAEITRLVDTRCFYVVPVVNPDGRYHFFADPGSHSNNRSLRLPRDDDRDGLVDEDFPDDLDGDGNICTMRRRDPFGTHRTHPEDPRLMIRVKPGEKGEWVLLGSEGIDNDGDGRINEDAEGYVDPNRNWGYDWMPPYVQSGSGDYPFSGRGLRELATYILARPNICMAWTFHNFGGMYLRGPSAKAQGEYPPEDVAVYDYIGKQAEKITPGYRYLLSWRDLYETYGDSGEWLAMTQGAYTLVGELYMSEEEGFGKRQAERKVDPDYESGAMFGDDAARTLERIRFSDHLTLGEMYKPWQAVTHPQFGEIEIGGWVKMSTRLPPAFLLRQMLHRNVAAVLFSAQQTPRVELEIVGVEPAGAGMHQVTVRLANPAAMPSMTAHARRVELYPQDMLTLAGDGLRVVAGGRVTNLNTGETDYVEHRPEIQFLTVPGFARVEYRFLVSGKGRAEVTYRSRHAGVRRVNIQIP